MGQSDFGKLVMESRVWTEGHDLLYTDFYHQLNTDSFPRWFLFLIVGFGAWCLHRMKTSIYVDRFFPIGLGVFICNLMTDSIQDRTLAFCKTVTDHLQQNDCIMRKPLVIKLISSNAITLATARARLWWLEAPKW